MNSSTELPPEEPVTTFFIGHHETSRRTAVTDDLLRQAEDLGYDFVTTSITTSAFQERIVKLVSDHFSERQRSSNAKDLPLPLISPLTPQDTILSPEASNPSRIAVTSSWIDLGSPDPAIAHLSRQVFGLEVGYAAFCGINNIMVYGPMESSDTVQYARAIREALGLGAYLQMHVLMPMTGELDLQYPDGTHLAEFTEAAAFNEVDDEILVSNKHDVWTVWDTIRSLCGYSQKLSIGTAKFPLLPFRTRFPFSCQKR